MTLEDLIAAASAQGATNSTEVVLYHKSEVWDELQVVRSEEDGRLYILTD
jgi:hypothetical protein